MSVQGWVKSDGWPTCALCNKPVDRVETSYCWVKNAVVVRAHCHGTYEDVAINNQLLLSSPGRPKIFIGGVAFTGAAILPAHAAIP